MTDKITVAIGFDVQSGRITIDGEPRGESVTDDILRVALKEAYLSGYKAGFYAAGNYFPDESWARYLREAKAR